MNLKFGTVKLLLTWTVLLFLFNLVPINQVYGQGHKQVEEANRLFQEEKYDEANNKYRDALIEQPESDIIHFNLGDVQYKKRNYEEAIKSYQKVLQSPDILMQAKGYYNLGNTLYKMGKLPESILNYKKALELNPQDQDAKYNLEYVRAKLKDNQDKQKQDQKQNQQQNQDQKKQEGQQDQKNQQENKQEQDDQKEKSAQDEQKQDQQKQEQQNQQKENGEDKQQEQEEQQGQEQKEISKEDAERILNALKNQEKDLMKNQKKQKVRAAFRGKDW